MPLRDELLRHFPALATLPQGVFVVGGAVRDLLLGLAPADVDIAAIDPKASAERVGARVVRLGNEDHLSAYRVVEEGRVYDFAELLGHDIAADLARRDFTVNAMAVDWRDGRLLDPHGGQADLQARVVRMVGAGNFDDDPLRCLKAVRMAVHLRFDIDAATVAAIRTRAEKVSGVAAERVTYELSLIFSADAFRRALELLRLTGLDRPLFGRSDFRFDADDVSPAGAYALLIADPRFYAERWRWSTDLLRAVLALQRLIERHDSVALFDAGETVASQLPPVLRALGRDAGLNWPDFSTRPLLSGNEIGSLTGLAEGPELGRIKRGLLEAQLRGQVVGRDDAVAFVRNWHVA